MRLVCVSACQHSQRVLHDLDLEVKCLEMFSLLNSELYPVTTLKPLL